MFCFFICKTFSVILAASNKISFIFATDVSNMSKELFTFKHFPLEVRVSTVMMAPHAHMNAWRLIHVSTPSNQMRDPFFAYFKLKCSLFCLDFLNILLV